MADAGLKTEAGWRTQFGGALLATVMVPAAGLLGSGVFLALAFVATFGWLSAYALVPLVFFVLLWPLTALVVAMHRADHRLAGSPPVIATRGYFAAGLIMTVPVLPLMCSVVTVVFLLSLPAVLVPYAVGLGLFVSLVLWVLFLGPSCAYLARPDRANGRQFAELVQRYLQIKNLVSGDSPEDATCRTAYSETRQCLLNFEHQLAQSGAQWLRANGYTNLWMTIHAAEEAAILIA